MDPVNYANILAAGQGLVPDYAAQDARKRLLGLQEGNLEVQRSQEGREQVALAHKIGQDQRKLGEQAGFQTDMDAVLSNPSTEAYARLIAKYPAFADQAKAAYSALDGERQKADLSQMAQIYAGVANGRPELAAQVLERRIAADKATDGTADPQDEAILGALKSGDSTQIKAAQGMIGVMLSAQTGPEHFGATLGRLTPEKKTTVVSPGGVLVDEATGEPVFTSPYKPEVIKLDDGTVVEYTPGDPKGTSGPGNVNAIFERLIQQESGGRAGVTGPETQYGRALGLTQLLPGTAKEMATKLGLPWKPELLISTSQAGADYQRTLGRAYFDEGLAKYGGDARKALMYYHGGPDEGLWGPKTRAYADAILSSVGAKGEAGGPKVVAQGQGKKEAPSATRVVGGKTYYKIKGRWFDNPEGA